MARKQKRVRTEAPYKVIAKVGENDDGSAKTIKHNVRNLLAYTRYLDAYWKEWRWFNVFNAKTREQIANYTKFNRPREAKIPLKG